MRAEQQRLIHLATTTTTSISHHLRLSPPPPLTIPSPSFPIQKQVCAGLVMKGYECVVCSEERRYAEVCVCDRGECREQRWWPLFEVQDPRFSIRDGRRERDAAAALQANAAAAAREMRCYGGGGEPSEHHRWERIGALAWPRPVGGRCGVTKRIEM